MQKLHLILICLFCFLSVQAQEVFYTKDKRFNWGGTIGLKSTLPVIHSITIDGHQADNIHLQYKVGYLASLFCRINIDRVFLQPSISWHHFSSDIRFTLPLEEGNVNPVTDYDNLEIKTKALEVPMLLGYNIVKEGPYGLSLMAGPKVSYKYNTRYNFNLSGAETTLSKNSDLFDINIVMGVGVSIWRLFFDFTYELGLNKTESDFMNVTSREVSNYDIAINKRVNVMSFSLGFLF